MSLLDSLEELSSVISDVTDLEVAEDLTEIFADIADRVSVVDRQYWRLVKTLALVEKERDPLIAELEMFLNDDLPLD